MFQCLDCNYNSDRKYNLQLHYKRKHKKEVNPYDIEKVDSKIEKVDMVETKELKMVGKCAKNINFFEKVDNKNKYDFEISNKFEKNEIILPITNQKLCCDKCKKEFRSISGYNYHILKCDGLYNNLECQFCHKIFASKSTKSRHMKTCKIKQAQIIIREHQNTVLNQIQNNNDNRQQIVNYHIYTGKINDNYESDDEDYKKIQRNDFGYEVTDYILPETIQNLATNLNVCGLLELKHFNPDHPENHNIRQNDKDSYKVLRNQKWEVDTKENVLAKLYNSSKGELYVYSIDNLFHKLLSDSDTDEYISRWVDYDKRSKKRIYKYMEVQLKEMSKRMKKEIKRIKDENTIQKTIE
tara:strand:- start:9731 stop:10789 length:1059 start_codon:yes stop_codon:yes gene_type:complete